MAHWEEQQQQQPERHYLTHQVEGAGEGAAVEAQSVHQEGQRHTQAAEVGRMAESRAQGAHHCSATLGGDGDACLRG